MIQRDVLYRAWRRHYSRLPKDEAIRQAQANRDKLVGQMRLLGASPGHIFRGFPWMRLQKVLGMAVGVHGQLLAGLTSAPQGGKLKGRRGGLVKEIKALEGFQLRLPGEGFGGRNGET